jgi:hypothetical protein
LLKMIRLNTGHLQQCYKTVFMLSNIIVVDENSTPIAGAVITVNGQQSGSTAADGSASINAADTDQVEISAPGFADQTLTGGLLQSTATIQMVPVSSVSSIMPWLLVGGAVLYFMSGKNKSIGSKKNNTAILLGVGAVGIAVVYMMSKNSAAPTTIPPVAGTTALSSAASPLSLVASLFGSGSSLTKGLSSLFGGASTPPPVGTAAAFVPVSSDETPIATQDVADTYTTIDPNAPTLTFAEAGVSGVRRRMGRI